MPLALAEHHRLLADARRETIDGITVLHLAGTPYAVGMQHGALCRDDIAAFRRAAHAYLGGEVASIPRLPGPFARLIARPLLLWQARAYLPFIAQEHREEMRGLADGAGVGLLGAVLINAIRELYLGSGCSEFAGRGRKSADGALLHGYNYDLLDPAQAFISPFLALYQLRRAPAIARHPDRCCPRHRDLARPLPARAPWVSAPAGTRADDLPDNYCFRLVMQPQAQRLWIGSTQVPAPLGRYIGFDLPSEAPLPDGPIAATGYAHSVRSYEHYTASPHQDALRELEQALALDGASAPLQLMLAYVYRACGQNELAEQQMALARGQANRYLCQAQFGR